MYKSHESYEVIKIHMKYMEYSFESVIMASDVFSCFKFFSILIFSC